MGRGAGIAGRIRPGALFALLCVGLVAVIVPPLAEGSAEPDRHEPAFASASASDTFALAPFKRSPFKRAPFKRAPFKRAPFKRVEQASPFLEQLVPTSVQRVGALASPVAAIDGRDTELDVDIAVLDGGVDADHPDLRVAGSVSCVPGADARGDVDGHGTMVAGLAAARDNGVGVVGVAPGARIWSVTVARPDGVITEAAARCGLEWLVAHADTIEVANLSWAGRGAASGDCGAAPVASGAGRPQRDVIDAGVEPELHALACRAHDAGIVLVAAAGNDSADASGYLPAAWPSVIAVSAIADSDGRPGGLGGSPCGTDERDDHLAGFSNGGAAAVLAAPGVCVASTDAHGGYAVGSGTSFAAPIVAGTVALLRVAEPGGSAGSIRARLLGSAEAGPIPGDRDTTPEGVVDASAFGT